MARGRVTLKDLAAELGLSVAAVSMALRNHRKIAAATRERVKAKAAELGYRPDPTLRALADYRTRRRAAARRWNRVALVPPALREDPVIVCFEQRIVYGSCMATKTISLELDAYEKLRAAKRAGESFSAVVRRASFEDELLTGEKLRAWLRSGGSGVSTGYLDAVEEAAGHDPVPDDPWA